MKFSTARTATIRIINRLVDLGIVSIAGSDRRGTKLYDLTPRGVSEIMIVLAETSGINPEFVLGPISRYAPQLLEKAKEYVKLVKAYNEACKKIESIIGERKTDDEECLFIDGLYFVNELGEGEEIKDWSDLEKDMMKTIKALIESFLNLPDLMVKTSSRKPRKYRKKYGELFNIVIEVLRETLPQISDPDIKILVRNTLEEISRETETEIKVKDMVRKSIKELLSEI